MERFDVIDPRSLEEPEYSDEPGQDWKHLDFDDYADEPDPENADPVGYNPGYRAVLGPEHLGRSGGRGRGGLPPHMRVKKPGAVLARTEPQSDFVPTSLGLVGRSGETLTVATHLKRQGRIPYIEIYLTSGYEYGEPNLKEMADDVPRMMQRVQPYLVLRGRQMLDEDRGGEEAQQSQRCVGVVVSILNDHPWHKAGMFDAVVQAMPGILRAIRPKLPIAHEFPSTDGYNAEHEWICGVPDENDVDWRPKESLPEDFYAM